MSELFEEFKSVLGDQLNDEMLDEESLLSDIANNLEVDQEEIEPVVHKWFGNVVTNILNDRVQTLTLDDLK